MSNHPITLPSEDMVQQWRDTWAHEKFCCEIDDYIAVRAALWGADQQLAKDAEWLNHNALNEPHLRITPVGQSLKEAMRPKPPSLKGEALEQLNGIVTAFRITHVGDLVCDKIRAALEALPE